VLLLGRCTQVFHRASSLVLADLEKSIGFLVALDRRREWFRFQHLFRDVLRAALTRSEPRRARELHERASRWHEEHDLLAEAIEQRSPPRIVGAAALLARNVSPCSIPPPGHHPRWLQVFSGGLEEHPPWPLPALDHWLASAPKLARRSWNARLPAFHSAKAIAALRPRSCTPPFHGMASARCTQAELAAHLEPPGSPHERALYLPESVPALTPRRSTLGRRRRWPRGRQHDHVRAWRPA
jgi:LuxR family maltose regulon positive regulatory protein